MPVRSKITALTMNLTIAHVIAILFVALIVLISLLLGKMIIEGDLIPGMQFYEA